MWGWDWWERGVPGLCAGWGWSEPGAWRELAQGKWGGFYRVKLWGRIANKAQVSCSLVCGGVIDSWLIVHQKIAVSGLGESSPCGCLPFKLHSFTELLWTQFHWFLCEKKVSKPEWGISKHSLQNSEVLLFTLKFHFESQLHFRWWNGKVKLSQLELTNKGLAAHK